MRLSGFLSEEMLERRPYLGPVVALIFATLLFLPGLGARDFWAPGEPIYAEVIRGMYGNHDWVVPMLNGQLYPDKPVLYFWLALMVSKLAGGVSEWTVRLPAAFGGIGLVALTYQFGKTFYDRQTGLLSALVLATSSRVLWESRFLRLDTVLSFFLFLGFYVFLKAFIKKRSKKHYLWAYFCFALATLTKGPIGLVLPALALLGLIAISGRWREIGELCPVTGAIVVILTLTPWLWLLHLRGEDQWVRDFIWTHNIQNYALKPIGHIRPFYYYFANLPPDFLPWTLFVPGALLFYYPWKEGLRNPVTLGLVCWFAAIFLFFSASKSKIAYYLLPLLPSLALLVGCYLKALMTAEEPRGIHWQWTAGFLYLLVAALGLGGVALPAIVYRFANGLFLWAWALASILVGGSVAMFVCLRRRQVAVVFISFAALLLGLSLVGSAGVLPYLDTFKSPRPIAEFVRFHLPKSQPVYVFKSTMVDFNYYARRDEIPVVASEDEVAKLAHSGREAYLIINDKDLKRFRLGTKFKIVTESRVGERRWYLLDLS
jgi:4-amino-4-deoxy-L-arabinose transferase-like glycosyltransferase